METDEKAPSTLSLDSLTNAYVRIRDARAEKKRAFEEEDKVLAESQALIANEMLEVCKQLNANSINTPHGTIIRSVKSRYWTNDWDSMYRFIKENNAFGLLEKRLHQSNMKEFLVENPDVSPMGLNVENEYTIVVRRAKS